MWNHFNSPHMRMTELAFALLFVLARTTLGQEVKITGNNVFKCGNLEVLTCSISPFTSAATWSNDGVTSLIQCSSNGLCLPSGNVNVPPLNYSADSSHMYVTINPYNESVARTWICAHNTVSDTFTITPDCVDMTTDNISSTKKSVTTSDYQSMEIVTIIIVSTVIPIAGILILFIAILATVYGMRKRKENKGDLAIEDKTSSEGEEYINSIKLHGFNRQIYDYEHLFDSRRQMNIEYPIRSYHSRRLPVAFNPSYYSQGTNLYTSE